MPWGAKLNHKEEFEETNNYYKVSSLTKYQKNCFTKPEKDLIPKF